MELSERTLRFIEEHVRDDVRSLALQGGKYPEVDMAAAVVQIAGRQAAGRKVPSWYRVPRLLYPRHLPMEQCSSETTALYKAGLLHGDSLADLTGGLGIDCAFIARNFRQADYVERQEELCELARHNFPLLGLHHIRVHHQDGVRYLQDMEPVDCIFLDPARRDGQGGKTVAISDCEPDVARLEPLLVRKAGKVLVKLSPMLDLALALKELRTVSEAHVLSVHNECKELLLLLREAPAPADVPIHCEHVSASGEHRHYVFTQRAEKECVCPLAAEAESFLYEPNASILKAGAFRSLTQAYPVKKLHINSHLYTSSALVPDFPGRKFRVESTAGFGKQELKRFLHGMEQANLTVRNFPASVADLRKRFKLKEGGDSYVFATTLADERKVLIRCSKV